MERLRRALRREQFHPGVLGLFTNPFWIARRGLARGIREVAAELQGRLLDVGCGSQPYRQMFRVDEYVGLEIDTAYARSRGFAQYFYDGSRFPFEDESFDCVLCNQVLEHVFEPDDFLAEVRRVLKPGGRFVFTVPFVWDEHEQPWDFARYTSFGLPALLERHGLVVRRQLKLGADASVLFQLMNAYLYKVLPSGPWMRRFTCLLLMAPISMLGIVLGRLLPDNPDLYLDQLVVGARE